MTKLVLTACAEVNFTGTMEFVWLLKLLGELVTAAKLLLNPAKAVWPSVGKLV